MTKNELVDFIASEAGLTKTDAAKALDATVAGITAGIKNGGKVSLVGFGTFSVKTRAAREGINPLTKKPLSIPEKKVASFKAGTKLKEVLN